MSKSPKDNIVLQKSFAFALRVVRAYQFLISDKKEYVLSKQFLKSGTSIGANVKEGIYAQSRKEFISKLNISLKEAHETEYWIQLMHSGNYLSKSQNDSLLHDVDELIRLLTSIIKTTRKNNSTF